MDEALDRILEGAPRRSVVLVDGGKESEDGGYVHTFGSRFLN